MIITDDEICCCTNEIVIFQLYFIMTSWDLKKIAVFDLY